MSFIYSGIDHVMLAAPEGCETAARRFYSELLGWVEIPKPENLKKRGGVWFQCGVHQVHIGVQPNFVPATKAHPAFQVNHLNELRAHLNKYHVAIIDDEVREDEGVIRFYLNDPFGNRLEFLEWTGRDTKIRFTNRVENYVKYRPSYPLEAIDYLYQTVGINPESEVADIGAGTGIFSQLLLQRGSKVTAVEPNQAMREAAERMLAAEPRYTSVIGSAEDTQLQSHSIDFIVCAQAFHWFDQAAAQLEFRRVLKSGGKAVLIWNSRLIKGSAFLEEYEQLLNKFGTDYAKVNHSNISQEALDAFFKQGEKKIGRFKNSQKVDYEGLSGRLLSSSYIPVIGHPSYEPMMVELKDIFERNNQHGIVSIDYETEVYWGEV
jgi:ubiquinone/menaquinone biosynthesis C-methylase UbiE/catechol 2,3-dioxygenase-like lactoylglutathione lyase family enzyme